MHDKSQYPIFVTGIERSGCSLIAKIIAMSGAFTGQCTPMQENLKIKEFLDNYYYSIMADPRGQYPLPTEKLIPTDWNEKIYRLLRSEGYNNEKLWMYKGSRIVQTWPIWNYTYPNAKWIIVRRRTADVLQSCLHTDFMNAYSNKITQQSIKVSSEREGWLWWVHEHEKLFIQMMEIGLNIKVIWPERMLHGNLEQVYDMLEWLGLSWNPGIVEYLETRLFKHTDDENNSGRSFIDNG